MDLEKLKALHKKEKIFSKLTFAFSILSIGFMIIRICDLVNHIILVPAFICIVISYVCLEIELRNSSIIEHDIIFKVRELVKESIATDKFEIVHRKREYYSIKFDNPTAEYLDYDDLQFKVDSLLYDINIIVNRNIRIDCI